MDEQVVLRRIARVAIVLGLAVFTCVASAALVTPTNLDDITPGASVENPGLNVLIPDVGDLDAEVFYNSATGLYTYQFLALPETGDAHSLITPTDLYGFNSVAGWSYSDAAAAGGPGDASAWSIDWSLNDRLTWQFPAQEGGSSFLDAGESMRFFYQSSHAPSGSGIHVLGVGATSGWAFAPRPDSAAPPIGGTIPEPAGLGLVGLAMLGLKRRRR